MKLEDKMNMIRRALKEERASLEKFKDTNHHMTVYLEGKIEGIETALYFLDDPEIVEKREAVKSAIG